MSSPSYGLPYDLNPLSYASTVIGFISFAFTLLTLLRVTWGNIIGLWEAPDEIRYTFANLKSALHDERSHCRVAWRTAAVELQYERDQKLDDERTGKRRHSHGSGKGHKRRKSGGGAGKGRPPYSPTLAGAIGPYGSDPEDALERHPAKVLQRAANWQVLYGSVKRLCKQFSEIERPFLKASVLERQQIAREARQEKGKAAFDSDFDSDDEPGLVFDEANFAVGRGQRGFHMTEDYLQDYGTLDLRHRFMWLQVRSAVHSIGAKLQAVQLQRSSQEMTSILRAVATIEAGLRDLRLIQDQHGRGSGHARTADDRRGDGQRWERVHVRRSTVQDD